MFDNIISFFFQKSVAKYQKENVREKRFVNYSKASSILLLFESDFAENNPEVRDIIQTLEKDGKKVTVYGYLDKKEIETAILPQFSILNSKNLNVLKKPQDSFLHELKNKKFDLLIDLSVKEVIPLKYIALNADAACKTGIKKGNVQFYDFILDTENLNKADDENSVKITLDYIFNQIIFYLKCIQTSD